MRIFNKDRALTRSWDLLPPSIELLRRNIVPVMYLSFLPGLFITVGATMIGSKAPALENVRGHELAGLVILCIAVLWEVIVFPGYIYLQAEAAKGSAPATLACVRNGLRRFFPLIGTSILGAVMILVGFIFLVIPGLILVRSFFLSSFYAVDGKMNPYDALIASEADSKPVSAWIWGTIGVAMVFSFIAGILGRVPVAGVVLSALASYPFSFATALRYNEIRNGINPCKFVRHTTEV